MLQCERSTCQTVDCCASMCDAQNKDSPPRSPYTRSSAAQAASRDVTIEYRTDAADALCVTHIVCHIEDTPRRSKRVREFIEKQKLHDERAALKRASDLAERQILLDEKAAKKRKKSPANNNTIKILLPYTALQSLKRQFAALSGRMSIEVGPAASMMMRLRSAAYHPTMREALAVRFGSGSMDERICPGIPLFGMHTYLANTADDETQPLISWPNGWQGEHVFAAGVESNSELVHELATTGLKRGRGAELWIDPPPAGAAVRAGSITLHAHFPMGAPFSVTSPMALWQLHTGMTEASASAE